MYSIKLYKTRPGYGSISQNQVKRNWMEDTHERHAYNCFPVTLTNSLGWSISFPEDISFIWDGISDSSPDHVKILKGEKYAYTGRSNATVSFHTGLMFITEEDVSMLGMPTPNQLIDGAQPFTTLISTSFFRGEFPVAWRVTRPNVEITIPAGTPIITVLPLSLTNANNSEMVEHSVNELPNNFFPKEDYGKIVNDLNKQGKWSNFYRDAVDPYGNVLGKHETKSLRFKTIERDNNA